MPQQPTGGRLPKWCHDLPCFFAPEGDRRVLKLTRVHDVGSDKRNEFKEDSYPFFHVCAPAGPEWNIMPPASSWPTKTSELGRSGFLRIEFSGGFRQSGPSAIQMEYSTRIRDCPFSRRDHEASDTAATR